MVEPDEAVHVGDGMLLQVLDLDLGNLGPSIRDPGVCDYDVEMVDAVRGEPLHSVGGDRGDRGIDLDDEKGGACGLGQVGKSSGRGVTGVAVGGDDRVGWFGKVELEEALADSSVGAGDQHDGRCHGVLGS